MSIILWILALILPVDELRVSDGQCAQWYRELDMSV